ncbi:MAG: hypothetical protein J07AB43_04730 [Candidatus Nanosalina sp. J07AB43]|nr:MAG: hypothetical protein J07AB43_04730 [Candidatus Nanosalina sp. J07AB43]
MDAADSLLNPHHSGQYIEEDLPQSSDTTEILTWKEVTDSLPEDISIVNHELVHSPEEAKSFANGLDGPVVIKSAGDTHRTEKDLVSTGLYGHEIKEESRRILDSSQGNNLVVQEQLEGLELLVSFRQDDLFGPIITVAPGGIHTEAYSEHEITFLAPVSTQEVKRRIQGTVIDRLLTGRMDYDREAILELIEKVAATAESSQLASLEINPVIVTETGAQCVDLLAKR